MKTGILFAGQGAQKTGMGRDFYEKSELFRKAFDLLSEEEKRAAFDGPDEVLADTRVTQPVMAAFAAGVTAELFDRGIVPAMAAGLSLGEYSALHAGGVFTAPELIDIVRLRACQMHKAAEGIDCAMYACIGIERDLLKECCEEAKACGVVSMVNFNCPGQIVISGERKAAEKCAELAAAKGAKRCMALPVSGPFHTEFMKPAGEALRKRFETADFGEMKIPVVFNAVAREKRDDETVAELLVKQVSGSVYFEDSVRYMENFGIDTVIEVGPGKTLSSFVRKTAKGIKCLNIETYDDLLKAEDYLKGER